MKTKKLDLFDFKKDELNNFQKIKINGGLHPDVVTPPELIEENEPEFDEWGNPIGATGPIGSGPVAVSTGSAKSNP